jgi:fibronectin-binding autotransporter adhesin
MLFASRSSYASAPAFGLLRGIAAIAVAAGFLAAGTAARAADTLWQTGTTPGQWSTAGNWSNGVPNSTTDAYTGGSGASIILGAGAQAKTFFVEGPIGGESTLTSGTLTLADQLWINIASGSTEATTVPLRLYDAGSAPVSVTANNATLGVDPGTQGGVILDSLPGGSVTFAVTNTLTIGYDGSGSYVYTSPLPGTPAGSAAITADTIQTSVTASAGATDYNYIGTYNAGHSVTATNLVLGVSGSQGGADNYGGNWTIVNTSLADQSTSAGNYLTITDGGTFTNTGAFAVGVRGNNNTVYVGYADPLIATSGSNGTLLLTGPNDLVIGSGSTAANNQMFVDHASTVSVNAKIIVGVDGTVGRFRIDNGSTVTSAGARLGVNAGSSGNTIEVRNGSSMTMNGTVRVGDKGQGNQFGITSGGTVTITGSGNNFYVGYNKSADENALVIGGTGSTLVVRDTDADLVISANVGSGSNATLNILAVIDGGVVDANRTLVGAGGQIWGNGGTIKGDTFVGAGGAISPGIYQTTTGTLTFTDNVNLASGGTFFVLAETGTAASFIDVGGTLTLGGTSALAVGGAFDPGAAYIIAHYGTLAGVFSSFTGLPVGATVDYNYLGLNQIAIITAVPEIAMASAGGVAALLACSLALLQRRSLRRRRQAGRTGPTATDSRCSVA